MVWRPLPKVRWWADVALPGPTGKVSMFPWRSIKYLPVFVNLMGHQVRKVPVLPVCSLHIQGLEEDLVSKGPANITTLCKQEQVPPCFVVELQDPCSLDPQVSCLFINTCLQQGPLICQEPIHDLQVLPFKVLKIRYFKVLHPPQGGKDLCWRHIVLRVRFFRFSRCSR